MSSLSFKAELKTKKTLIFFILASLVFILGSAAQFKKSAKFTKNDFRVYYKTSVRIENREWSDIYTRKDGPFPYRYVPYTLPALTWMKNFPEQTSRKIWLVIQAMSFLAGYVFLYKSLRLTKTTHPLLAVSLTVLLTLRQLMDSLHSGQVAGFVFLSFSLGMYFYLQQKNKLDIAANSVATSLKIMPGFLLIHGLIKTKGLSSRLKYLLTGIILFGVFNALTFLWLKSYQIDHLFIDLWKNWVSIALADGEYFDGSTPKSQALRAFILRTFGKKESSEFLWKILFLVSLVGIIYHWFKNEAQTMLQSAYSYSLGILAFILLMPESLPYQLMNIAIPFAVFLADPKLKTSRFYKVTMILFMICISFASTDFIGRTPSDWMQDQSFAFFVLCLLTVITIRGSTVKNQVVST